MRVIKNIEKEKGSRHSLCIRGRQSLKGYELEMFMPFKKRKELLNAIEDYIIFRGFSLRTVKSDVGKLQYYCKEEN